MPASLSPDDLLVLLALARSGRLIAAAHALKVNHTTVGRRIAALEKAAGQRLIVSGPDGWVLTDAGHRAVAAAETIEAAVARLATPEGQTPALHGAVRIAAPDGFALKYAVPAVGTLMHEHPGLDCELIAATQRLRQTRTGIDIEVVVGEPQVHRATAVPLLTYRLGLYATGDYLTRYGRPGDLADLDGHRLVYYIESALQVDDLDVVTHGLPTPAQAFTSTSVFVHVRAAAAGYGIGVLPTFLAEEEPGLERVLEASFDHEVAYWAVVRAESYRDPAVHAALDALRRVCAEAA